MKLLFGIKSLAVVRGGAERVLSDLCSGLAEKGHEVFIVTFDKKEDRLLYSISDKIKVIKIGIGDPNQRSNLTDFIRRVIGLRKVINKIKPDIVIGFMTSIYILFSFVLILTKYPLISSEHSVPEYYKKRKLEFALLIFAGLLSQKITVLSSKVKLLYPKILHSRMEVLPNPVTIIKKTESKVTACNIILSIGRLEQLKNHETLIRAFVMIHEKFPEWRLRIVGDGKLKNFLIDLVKSYSIQKKVIFVGSISNVEKEYEKASFFVLPSLYESFGLVTIEAMAFELPVIGFRDCDGTNELVTDNYNGLLVSGDNRIKSLSNGMEKLMSDQFLLDSLKANTKNTAKQFSIDNVLVKWERMFNLVIKEQ
jgi:glycosyltransferase involved in cell wall biosynthesis